MVSRKVILRAIGCALLAILPFPEQENQIYDFLLKTLSRTYFQAPEEVVVVEISQENFESLRKIYSKDKLRFSNRGEWWEKFENIRHQFFWNDEVYSAVIKRVLEDQPKRFLITFFFHESLVLLEKDSPLQKLARDPAVLWASQFDLDQKLLKPSPELTGTENYGFTNILPDSDGVIRRAQLIARNHISLPFRAILDDPSSFQTTMPISAPFQVRFSGRPGFIRTCSILELFQSESVCGNLKDKFVILSPTRNIVAGANLYRTPVGYMSRGEALANILLTALHQNPIRNFNKWLFFLLILGHSLFLSQVILRTGSKRQLITMALLLGAEVFLSLLFMRFFSIHLPILPFVIVTIATYITFFWVKFAQQESKRWQAEKKSQYLKELDELKSNFLSLMSHDLKTPIAKVQALTERLTREGSNLSEEQKQILSSVHKSNDELAQYIVSLLNFQKIESQEMKLQKKSNDINLVIEDVVNRLLPLAKEKEIEVELVLEPMFAIEFDEQLIKQVLSNLIDNAIKYNNSGTKVTVRTFDLGEKIEVLVEDNGVGIEPDQMAKLFKKFSRSEKGTSERVKGTGLGLYLAKYFLELHGGSIQVESELGKGTKFHCTLPVNG
jgi:two-component system, OmpR family, phosphate regulon sensor histidine kinase PhoR